MAVKNNLSITGWDDGVNVGDSDEELNATMIIERFDDPNGNYISIKIAGADPVYIRMEDFQAASRELDLQLK